MVCQSQARPIVEDLRAELGRQPMIASMEISNFRCFKKLALDDLRRINLIVGQNSSGKSAFLESIFLSSGTMGPAIAFQMRAIRKMGGVVILPTDASAYRGLFDDLFYDFDHERTVAIKISGEPDAETRSLQIKFHSPAEAGELPFDKSARGSSVKTHQSIGMPQIQFVWKRKGKPQVLTTPRFSQTGMQVSADTSVDFFPCVWFTPGAGDTPDENAKRFSELDKRGRLSPVLKALSTEFPYIKGLSIDYHAGVPMVFAEVAGKSQKLPVPLVSDGVNRLMGICLGIATYKDGVVLIDQLEDGFHHKLLPSIWATIFALATEFNVQLFVSTHSAECISAMRTVVAKYDADFSLLRASKRDDHCEIKVFDGKYLETALEQDFEVR